MISIKNKFFVKISNQIRVSVILIPFVLFMFITGNIFKYLLFLLFAFVHEAAHIVAALHFTGKYKYLKIYPAGFSASIDLYDLDTIDIFFVYVAGLMANLFLSVLFILIKFFLNINNAVINNIILINTALFLINIVPVKPLDGAHIVRLIFQTFTGYVRSERIVAGLSLFLLPVIFAVSLIQIVARPYNISLLLIGSHIFFGYNKIDCEVFYMIFRKHKKKINRIGEGAVYEIREMIVNEKTQVCDVYKRMDKDKYHIIKVCNKNYKSVRSLSEKKIVDWIMDGKGNDIVGNIK